MAARRFLYIIAGLIMLTVAAAIGWNLLQDRLMRAAFVPTVEFTPAPPSTDPTPSDPPTSSDPEPTPTGPSPSDPGGSPSPSDDGGDPSPSTS